jgi:quercetin dioxygenase-like cupin family protein
MTHPPGHDSRDGQALLQRIPRKTVRTDLEQLDIVRLGIFGSDTYELVEFRGGSFHPSHRHLRSDSRLHVVFGRGVILLDGAERPYAAGSTFDVPRGTSHGFRVQEDTLMLSIQNPPILDAQSGKIDFVYDGRD